MEELLSLKWNNHKSTFLHVLSILRDKQLYTDATIACDRKFYSVHKLVLSTCSDYFSAMLDRTNCKNPVIVLKDIKCEDLEALLDYMYLGEVNVRQGDLATLIKAAECLQVKGLAVPDDEPPPPRKTKTSESQSRKRDSSRSPPAKRKRHSDVDDVRPIRPLNVDTAPLKRPKSPVATISSSPSPVQIRNAPLRPPTTNKLSSDQNSLQQGHSSTSTTTNSSEQKQEHDTSNLSDCFVKVEMVESSGAEVETYDLSNEGTFKEEGGDDGATSGGGGGESVGDLSNDLPEFLQQASDPGAYGHSSFVGSSSFQPSEMTDWQGDGSNTGFSQVNFESAEGSSQQNAPGEGRGAGSSEESSRFASEQSGCDTKMIATHHALSCKPASAMASKPSTERKRTPVQNPPNPLDSNIGDATGSFLQQSIWMARAGSRDSLNASPTEVSLPGLTCPFCSKLFCYKSFFDRHLRTHTNERPFQCHLCPYSARTKANLKSHCVCKHPELVVGSMGSLDDGAAK